MKECTDIKNSLPLYLDDSLSGADKKAVEEHLKSCPQCKKDLTQLSKTETLVNSLARVNPPPWFKQKIMARVREEAEKKSFVQKWFYPLRIKIPVQIFATVCIAVLAVYIYRAGEEQMKEVVPSSAPAPVIEVQKGQLPEQKMKTFTDKEIKKDNKTIQKKEVPREIVREIAADTEKDVSDQVSSGVKADKYESSPAGKSVALPEAAMEKKKESDAVGAALQAARAPQAQILMQRPKVLLKVSDTRIAAAEVEKLLVKYEAKNITREIKQGKAVIMAELKNQKIKDLTTQLKTIGRIDSKDISADSFEDKTIVVIEIVSN